MKNLEEKLIKKGWERKYIDKAVKIFNEDNKHPLIKKLDKVVYWTALMIVIAGNFLISTVLIPFIITISNSIALGIIIFSISLTFGYLFNVLLKDIESIDNSIHIISGFFLPSISLINVYIMTNVSNHFMKLLNYNSKHNPYLIGIIYILAFMTPYLIDKLFLNNNSED